MVLTVPTSSEFSSDVCSVTALINRQRSRTNLHRIAFRNQTRMSPLFVSSNPITFRGIAQPSKLHRCISMPSFHPSIRNTNVGLPWNRKESVTITSLMPCRRPNRVTAAGGARLIAGGCGSCRKCEVRWRRLMPLHKVSAKSSSGCLRLRTKFWRATYQEDIHERAALVSMRNRRYKERRQNCSAFRSTPKDEAL